MPPMAEIFVVGARSDANSTIAVLLAPEGEAFFYIHCPFSDSFEIGLAEGCGTWLS